MTKLSRNLRTLGSGNESQPPVPAERRRGRPPTEVTQEMVDKAALMARFGATDEEIAAELGCTVGTLYIWYRQWPELSQAVIAGKENADDRVQRSLYGRAVGFTYEAEKVFSNGFRATVTERVLAEPGAAFNWLKNRRRKEWTDRHETEIIVPETQGDRPSTRQLALASLALLSQAAYTPEPTTIDVTPNTVEEAEDDEQDTYSDAEEAGTEAFDPDFDL